ncbi:MAG: hypothetical protein QM793_00815 [Muricomes sp.]
MITGNIENLKESFRKEIDSFEKVGNQFLNGEITRNEFKGTSGGLGVYAQKEEKKFMIRLRVLSRSHSF